MHACCASIALCLVPLIAASGVAQEQQGAKPPARLTISRVDLARAYMRMDAAFTQHPPPAEKMAEVNTRFDDATKAFFGGSLAKVAEGVNALTADLLPDAKSKPRQALADSLKLKLDGLQRAWIQPVYRPKDAPSEPQTYSLRIARNGMVVREIPFTISADAKAPIEVSLADSSGQTITQSGKYTVAIAGTDIVPIEHRPAYLTTAGEGNIFEQAQRRDEAMAKLNFADNLKHALAAWKARNALIVAAPSETNSAEFLADPIALSDEVQQEMQLLRTGKDPYAGKTGDYWRVFAEGQTKVPFRVYVPESVKGKASVPLVVAFHGAGGDENMFMDTYGQGEIKRLADKHGFVVASPATFYFAVNGKYFDTLLEVMQDCYPIDPKHVYVLGHSMGGGATSFLARDRPDRIAAAACLAGGRGFPTKGKFAPTLVIAAELDGIIPLAALREGAQPAISAGMPIEFRTLSDYGHTLMVGVQLPIAVQWLFEH
jgi:pimeloyl-ACP methyl ester carboxylesterase